MGCSPPAEQPLPGGESLPEKGVVPTISFPASNCSPEEDALRGGRTPAKPPWSEVIIFLDVFLLRESFCPEENATSDEQCAHRKTVLRRVAQLRGANAGRRRMHFGRMYSGEADVVGVDDLFGSPPPAKDPSPELTGRSRSPHQFTESVSNRGGLFSFPTLHLLTTVIYCLSKGGEVV